MKWNSLFLIIPALFSSLPGVSQEENAPKIQLVITPHPYLGVQFGDELNFYQYSDSLGWKKWGDYVTLPVESDELIITPAAQIGVRRGISLSFYSVGLFFLLDQVDSLKFLIPGSADELILTTGYDLGVRKGQDLKFYTYMNGNWVYNEPYDHHFEEPVDEMVLTSTNLLGVRNGNRLKFYQVTDQYKYIPEFDFTFVTPPDEIIITGQGELGVRNGTELKFYFYDKEWKYANAADFHLEPRVKADTND